MKRSQETKDYFGVKCPVSGLSRHVLMSYNQSWRDSPEKIGKEDLDEKSDKADTYPAYSGRFFSGQQ